MERREFFRHAAAGAAGMVLSESEKEVVDSRLTQKLTLAFKGTALADVCDHLRVETGVHLTAGASVADDKVTLFCRAMPLRDVMRALSRPFGFTWVRSAKGREYRYELMQDLRSQLLEEELRNRDRNAALLALDREIERFRPYLDLSPDEAFERAKTAPPAEKALLDRLATDGWGPMQMYFRLSGEELAALRAGQDLIFRAIPRPGERPLPPDVERGVIQSHRHHGVYRRPDGHLFLRFGPDVAPDDLPLSAVPEARGAVCLRSIRQSEPGEFMSSGLAGTYTTGDAPAGWNNWWGGSAIAAGRSTTVAPPNNAAANQKLAGDAALQPPVTITCGEGEKVTSADVLEAIHQATGLPVVSDYYTRLHPVESVTARGVSRFDALNALADAMHLRWRKDGAWLQFRSATYYHDRLKEVPNRLLSRWVAARQEQGLLTLDDLVEIAQLTDAQLDGAEMAEGAEALLGLREWSLARSVNLRKSLRYLGSFTPEQRQATMRDTGLGFAAMTLLQQQQFLSFALPGDAPPFQSLTEMAGATLRVEYTQPNGFHWGEVGSLWHLRFVIPLADEEPPRRLLRPVVRAETRTEALERVRQTDLAIREALLEAVRREDPRREATLRTIEEEEIGPTRLDLIVAYIPGTANNRPLHLIKPDADVWVG